MFRFGCLVLSLGVLVFVLGATGAEGQTAVFDLGFAAGSAGIDQANGLDVDADGNIYITGVFAGAVDFDPGPGEMIIAPVANRDGFIQKIDADGNLLFVATISGDGFNAVSAVSAGASGEAYIIGSFAGTADLDPGPGVVERTSVESNDSFLLALDAAGNFRWVQTLPGNNVTSFRGILFDGGRLFCTGSMRGTLDFDPGPGEELRTQGGTFPGTFVWELDADGNLVDVITFGEDDSHTPNDIVLDDDNNLLLAGTFVWTIDFDPGPGVTELTSSISGGAYIVKFDELNGFVYAASFSGTDFVGIDGIGVDAAGNVYASGSFGGSADFDPGPEVFLLRNFDAFPLYTLSLDALGDFRYAVQTIDPFAVFVHVESDGSLYNAGQFDGTIDLDPGPGVLEVTAAGNRDAFVQKLDPEGNLIYGLVTSGPGSDQYRNFVVSPDGRLHAVGLFDTTVDLDPGPGVVEFTSAGSTDYYVQRLLEQAAGEGEGEGEGELPTLSPRSGDFGLLAAGDSRVLSFRLMNGGAAELPVTLSLGGSDPEVFSIESPASVSVPANDFVVVDIEFAPATTGDREAFLEVEVGFNKPPLFRMTGTALTGFGGIEGVVLDDAGAPVQCGAVAIQGTGGGDAVVSPTDVDGRYVAGFLPAGEYAVTVVAPGFASEMVNVDVVAGPNQTADFDLVPGAAGVEVIAGEVVVDGGGAIGGVRVELINPADDAVLGFTYTCADGRYEIPVPELKVPVRVQFSAPGFQVVSTNADSGDTAPVNATLLLEIGALAGVADGSVVAAGIGGPVRDARVILTNSVVTRSAQTSSDGSFSIGSMIEGQYSARVSASGFETLEEAVTIFAGDPTPVSLALTSVEGEGEGEGEGDTEGNGETGCAASGAGTPTPRTEWAFMMGVSLAILVHRRERTMCRHAHSRN